MKDRKKNSKGSRLATPVAIIAGSASDVPVMRDAAEALKLFDIGYDILVMSAHRTPTETIAFASSARKKGYRVIIAGAGGAAHLPGIIAALTELPVIGVPIATEPLRGQDSLLSIVQMPKGIPVATVAIGNAWNAGLLATQILGASEANKPAWKMPLLDKIRDYKESLRRKVLNSFRQQS
ncbi:MAG: 5-(carboxyamino)imidazole ribonucleotide mutase [Bdellovibrionota bacterium]